jgi:hypothetical protein
MTLSEKKMVAVLWLLSPKEFWNLENDCVLCVYNERFENR